MASDDARGLVGVSAVHAGHLDGSPTALADTHAGRRSRNAAPFPSALIAADRATDDAVPVDSFSAVTARRYWSVVAEKDQTHVLQESLPVSVDASHGVLSYINFLDLMEYALSRFAHTEGSTTYQGRCR